MKKKVLIVDDIAMYRNMLQMFLTFAKFDCVLAVDGLDALRKLEKDKFDLVISDVEMPNMNGFELLVNIKKKLPSLPVIMLTTLDNTVYIDKARKLGASHYIVKPYTKEKIEAALIKVRLN